LLTNEQAVLDAERQMAKLKKEYLSVVNPIVVSGNAPSIQDVLVCQQFGAAFFNYLESFVGDSDLLGAHKNGLWITSFAETCHSVLKAYVAHITFLRKHASRFQKVDFEPSDYAFANMQRMVTMYLEPNVASELKELFINKSLPIKGFIMPAHEDVQTAPKWQLIVSLILGVCCIVVVLFLAFSGNKLTSFQELILRGLFSMGVTSIGQLLAGFVEVKGKFRTTTGYLTVLAGGSLGIFLITWFCNPGSLI